MAKQGVWRRWNPLVPDDLPFATNYLTRMSFQDSLHTSAQVTWASACPGAPITGMPFSFFLERAPQTNRLGQLDPVIPIESPGFYSGTMQWAWAASSPGFEPFSYALICFVRTVGFVEIVGSIREWPQEGVEKPCRSPWRYNWPMKVTNATFPDISFYYEWAPCWWDCDYKNGSANTAELLCAVPEFRGAGIGRSCIDSDVCGVSGAEVLDLVRDTTLDIGLRNRGYESVKL